MKLAEVQIKLRQGLEKKKYFRDFNFETKMKTQYGTGGALIIGRILVAFYFVIDGCYKTSDQAWPGYRDFIFLRFTEMGLQHEHIGYGAMGDVIATIFIMIELFGAILLLLGFRVQGCGLLVGYLIPMSFISHKFITKRGIDMTQFLPFLQVMAMVGAIIVMGAYPNNITNDKKTHAIENTRDVQRDVNKPAFAENELPAYQEGSAFVRKRV